MITMKKLFAVAMAALFLVGATALAMAQQTVGQQSKATADVIKMASAGIGDDVLLSYVQGSRAQFHLSADDIIALKEAKVGAPVIQAMIEHDSAAASSVAPSSAAAAPAKPLNPDPSVAPAPLVEVVPIAPGPGYEWAPGYWSWDGTTWVWIYGGWRPHVFFGMHRRGWWR